MTRVKPDSSNLTQKIIETKWNSTYVIIAFYDQTYKLPKQNDPGQQNYLRIISTIFIKADSNNYNKLLIDTIDIEGGDPIIESVFFANADTDKEKELIIISSWEQRHYDANGKLYGTFVYDNLPFKTKKTLKPMKAMSEKLDGGMDGTVDGKDITAKFKTADDIKAELARLGYK